MAELTKVCRLLAIATISTNLWVDKGQCGPVLHRTVGHAPSEASEKLLKILVLNCLGQKGTGRAASEAAGIFAGGLWAWLRERDNVEVPQNIDITRGTLTH